MTKSEYIEEVRGLLGLLVLSEAITDLTGLYYEYGTPSKTAATEISIRFRVRKREKWSAEERLQHLSQAGEK